MADGSRKAIATLQVGDEVKGQDGAVNKVLGNKPFYVNSQLYRIHGRKDAYVTANHPFYPKGGWKAIDVEGARKDHPGVAVTQLELGDVLVDVNGKEVVLQSMKAEDHGWLTVYNPSMSGNHTYFANDLLMHNIKCDHCEGGGGCFTGTTEVILADGSRKAIADLKKGD
ncbi:MAG: Hint domain-containing protein, partial [Pseudomonas sp.]